MRIRRLELHGFKSFPDRTRVELGEGISCVVGPNGCGKSNLVDAIRWCIGEQSARSLRAQQMSDVVFAGSEDRAPVGYAEVSITFTSEGSEPFPGEYAAFTEVQVTRRLYRSGTSEYLLNGRRARRRDVQDLFLDTGIGSNLYTFIEQGRVGKIIQATPEARRELIDEAAGITRFRVRREEATRKLKATADQLDRAGDLADELGRRAAHLRRQVRKVVRYRTLRTRVRQAEIALSLARFVALAADRRALRQQLAQDTSALQAAERGLARRRGDLEVRRAELGVAEDAARGAAEALGEAEGRGRALAGEAAWLERARGDLEAQQGSVTEERGRVGREATEASERHAGLLERTEVLAREEQAARELLAEVRGQLVDGEARRERCREAALATAAVEAAERAQVQEARVRLDELTRRRRLQPEVAAAAARRAESLRGARREAEERVAARVREIDVARAAVQRHRALAEEARGLLDVDVAGVGTVSARLAEVEADQLELQRSARAAQAGLEERLAAEVAAVETERTRLQDELTRREEELRDELAVELDRLDAEERRHRAAITRRQEELLAAIVRRHDRARREQEEAEAAATAAAREAVRVGEVAQRAAADMARRRVEEEHQLAESEQIGALRDQAERAREVAQLTARQLDAARGQLQEGVAVLAAATAREAVALEALERAGAQEGIADLVDGLPTLGEVLDVSELQREAWAAWLGDRWLLPVVREAGVLERLHGRVGSVVWVPPGRDPREQVRVVHTARSWREALTVWRSSGRPVATRDGAARIEADGRISLGTGGGLDALALEEQAAQRRALAREATSAEVRARAEVATAQRAHREAEVAARRAHEALVHAERQQGRRLAARLEAAEAASRDEAERWRREQAEREARRQRSVEDARERLLAEQAVVLARLDAASRAGVRAAEEEIQEAIGQRRETAEVRAREARVALRARVGARLAELEVRGQSARQSASAERARALEALEPATLRVEELRREREVAEARREAARAEWERRRSALRQAERGHTEAEGRLRAEQRSLDEARSRQREHADRVVLVDRQGEELAAEVARWRQLLEERQQALTVATGALVEASESEEAAASSLAAARARVQDASQHLATLAERRVQLAERVRDATDRVAELADRARELATRSSTLEAELALTRAEEERVRTERVQVVALADGSRADLERERHRVGALREALTEATTDLEERARDRDERQRLLAELEARVAEIRGELRAVRERMDERYQVSLPGLMDRLEAQGSLVLDGQEAQDLDGVEVPQVEPLHLSRPLLLDEARLRERITGLEADRAALARLGELHLGALDEYRETAGRHRDLQAQRADLEESIASIRKAIAHMNRVSRQRFRDTFDRVDEELRAVYPALVGGGVARLELTDEEDLLATGVDIVAQPPGKRLQSLQLLSGGEKAMVGIALILALFRVKPAPFCVMDEVDAPLDEANGARFNRQLRTLAALSQFVLITHNRHTMAHADTLYGVTMPEPGVSRLVSVQLGVG